MIRIGSQLRRLRLQRGLTMHELAALAKVRPSTICRLEQDNIQARLQTLDRIASALGATVAEITNTKET